MQYEVDIRPFGKTIQYGFYGASNNIGTLMSSAHYGSFLPTFQQMGVNPGVFPSDLANKALIKARLKVKSQDINLAQAFAERAQTAGLVADALVRLAATYRAFRNKNFRQIRRMYFADGGVRGVRRRFLQDWLAFQYGVKPLLSDIYGAVEALDKTPYDEYIVTVKAAAKQSLSGKVDWHKPGTDDHMSHYRHVVGGFHSSRVRIDVVPENGALATAAALGFTNPVLLAWELLPFSFVADWAYPLGNYFSQMDALAGWRVKGYSQSNFTKLDSVVTGLSFTQSTGYPTVQDWTGQWRYTKLSRTAGTSVPFATLPSVKNPISTTHLMNALALLTEASRVR
jgi:hypothetical protein